MSDSATTEKILTPEQRRAIDSLLATGDLDEAAAAAGCHIRTLQRWRSSDPLFSAALQAAQDAALDQTTAALVGASVASVKLLRQVVENESAKMPYRLRAAATLLDATLRWHELRSLAQRVAALEQRGTA